MWTPSPPFHTLHPCYPLCLSTRPLKAMSILLMPNHSSWHHQARNWMLAQMTNTYPPPPQPDGQHYNPLYPTSATSPQLMDSVQQGQLPYSGLSQSIFKTDSSTSNHADSNQHIQNLAQELQQRAALGEHQRQQLQQTAHHLQPQSGAINHPLAPAPTPQTPGQSESQDQAQKANRLRKACDSCSIRKVKVGTAHMRFSSVRRLLTSTSVTKTPHAKHVLLWTFHAHSSGPVGGVDLRTDMQKPSSAGGLRMALALMLRSSQEPRLLRHLCMQLKP